MRRFVRIVGLSAPRRPLSLRRFAAAIVPCSSPHIWFVSRSLLLLFPRFPDFGGHRLFLVSSSFPRRFAGFASPISSMDRPADYAFDFFAYSPSFRRSATIDFTVASIFYHRHFGMRTRLSIDATLFLRGIDRWINAYDAGSRSILSAFSTAFTYTFGVLQSRLTNFSESTHNVRCGIRFVPSDLLRLRS